MTSDESLVENKWMRVLTLTFLYVQSLTNSASATTDFPLVPEAWAIVVPWWSSTGALGSEANRDWTLGFNWDMVVKTHAIGDYLG